VHKDDVYESLFDDCDPELDTLTQMALELLSHSILLKKIIGHLQKLRKHHYPIFVVFPSKLISKDSTTICYLFFQRDATKVL
jgi:hypothetical protein